MVCAIMHLRTVFVLLWTRKNVNTKLLYILKRIVLFCCEHVKDTTSHINIYTTKIQKGAYNNQ